jgi:hypothetical protein
MIVRELAIGQIGDMTFQDWNVLGQLQIVCSRKDKSRLVRRIQMVQRERFSIKMVMK